ncbi:hypothetical protein K3495_g2758 [Podosphaera aphanis]|nr:hypothetical protein K3495_g2758 [Podosphaera aphanis]
MANASSDANRNDWNVPLTSRKTQSGNQQQIGSLNTVPSLATYAIAEEVIPPNFNVTDVDIVTAGKLFNAWVQRGSRITGVDPSILNVQVDSLPPAGTQLSVSWLVEHGMKLFDATVWIATPPSRRPHLLVPSNREQFKVLPLTTVAKSVFYAYFLLMTQAKYPDQLGANQIVPSILRNVFGLGDPPRSYMENICSFNPTDFDNRWIKHITFEGMGQEVISRLGLGVAGYRAFAPFKYLPLPADAKPELMNAYNWCRAVIGSPPTWSIHPITRPAHITSIRRNLNKNLQNLALDLYSEDDLQLLVDQRILYRMPTRQSGHYMYYNWAADASDATQDPIFLKNRQ